MAAALALGVYLLGFALAALVVVAGPFRPRGAWRWAAALLLALLWPVASVLAAIVLVAGDGEG